MKTLFFLFLWIAVVFSIQAQCDLGYKQFSSFKNNTEYKSDTIAYLMYNFDQRSDCYKGKTIGDILKDMEFPVVNFTRISAGDKIYDIYLNFKSVKGVVLNPLRDYYICITLRDSVSSFDIYSNLIKKYSEDQWVPQHYNYLKDVHVEKIKFNPELQEQWKSQGNKKL